MRVAQSLIDQILDRVDIVELIHARVPLKKAGKSYTACCPFHPEKSPSFHVNRDKGFYHCFGCQASGNAIGFLMNYERQHFMEALETLASQTGVTLPKFEQSDATKYQAKPVNRQKPTPANAVVAAAPPKPSNVPLGTTAGDNPELVSTTAQASSTNSEDEYFSSISNDDLAWFNSQSPFEAEQDYSQAEPLLHPSHPPSANDGNAARLSADFNPDFNSARLAGDRSLYDLLEQVAHFYQSCLKYAPQAQLYIEKRALAEKTCQYWQIGYAPSGWNHLEERFASDVDGLIKLGLVRTAESGRQYNLLRDRIIFPIRDRKGRVVGFGGRALSDEVKPKYINSPDSPVFHKNTLLFGLYDALHSRNPQWLVVEGYMDVIALAQQGISGAVAAMGTATNAEHISMLFKHTSTLTLAFDGDSAGQKAAWRTLEHALPLLNDGRELRFLLLPQGHDPDSLIRNEGALAFNQRIEHAPPLSDFLYSQLTQAYNNQQLEQPENKAAIYQQCKTYINLLPPTGTFKRLLEQTIRNRLGLGWNKKNPTVTADIVDYQQLSLEDKLVALVLMFPVLVRFVAPISDLFGNPAILSKLYQAISKQAPLLVDIDMATTDFSSSVDNASLLFFVLAAWEDDSEKKHLCHLIEHGNISEYLSTTERIVLYFQEQLLIHAKQVLKGQTAGQSLAQKVQWNSQLAELEKTLNQSRNATTITQLLHTISQN